MLGTNMPGYNPNSNKRKTEISTLSSGDESVVIEKKLKSDQSCDKAVGEIEELTRSEIITYNGFEQQKYLTADEYIWGGNKECLEDDQAKKYDWEVEKHDEGLNLLLGEEKYDDGKYDDEKYYDEVNRLLGAH